MNYPSLQSGSQPKPACLVTTPEQRKLAACIDHALLKSSLTSKEVEIACQDAILWQLHSVCVRPCDVSMARDVLGHAGVLVGTVIGFPHGTVTSIVKQYEAAQALLDGAQELDMVIDLPAVKDGRWSTVESDIRRIARIASEDGALLKVIIETCLLTEDEKIHACKACVQGGADFVKTSTGFAGGGATLEDIRLLRANLPSSILVKASGGIRTLPEALAAVQAGASRIGTSASFDMLMALEKGMPAAAASLGAGY